MQGQNKKARQEYFTLTGLPAGLGVDPCTLTEPGVRPLSVYCTEPIGPGAPRLRRYVLSLFGGSGRIRTRDGWTYASSSDPPDTIFATYIVRLAALVTSDPPVEL